MSKTIKPSHPGTLRVILGKPLEYPICIMDGRGSKAKLYAGVDFANRPPKDVLRVLRNSMQKMFNDLAEQ